MKIENDNKYSNYCKLIVALIVMAFSQAGMAWNAAGHQLMAAITWDLLDRKQRDYWVDILKQHPRFVKDFKNKKPKYVKFNPRSYNEWIFRQAAVWPDIARGFKQKEMKKYHHGSWHYINYPIYLDKKVDTSFLNRSSKWNHKFSEKTNIVQALKANIEILSKDGATKKQKAIALSWVLHLQADLHQPLHTTALFSENYFPTGDKGGNSIKISGQGRIENLHRYWDSALNNTTSFKVIDLKAQKLRKKYKKSGIKNQNNNIEQALDISHKKAIKYAYTPMILDVLRKKEKQSKPQPSIYISNSYNRTTRITSEIQITKAAYQVATFLNTFKRN